MKDKQKVKYMGQKVAVYFELRKWCESEKLPDKGDQIVSRWRPEKLDKPRSGWIVGFRSMQEGYVAEGTYDPEEGTERYLHQIGRVEAVQVCYWPTVKPVLVPIYGFDSVDHGEPVSPAKWAWDSYREETQRRVREMMKSYAGPEFRNPNTGRFKK